MFAENSYMVFQGVKGAWEELHVFVKFKPKSGSGIILYNGGAESLASTHNYILVQLVQGYIQLKFECGSGPAVITSRDKVLIDSWNTVEIDRFRQHGSLSLNGNVAEKGISQGHSISLNLGESMIVGGSKELLKVGRDEVILPNNSDLRMNGFDGCIQDLIINGKRIDLVRDFLANKEILDCSSNSSPCLSSPCLNNGKCQVCCFTFLLLFLFIIDIVPNNLFGHFLHFHSKIGCGFSLKSCQGCG